MKGKNSSRSRIKISIRKKIRGTASRPRLSVFRSNRNITCQIILDSESRTLVSASNKELPDCEGLTKKAVAKRVGLLVADKAKKAGIESVTFDRNGYLYHGRVREVAEGAREGGLAF